MRAEIRVARCGFCHRFGGLLIVSQAYISHLASIPLETFTKVGVRVVVIGCGEWDVIPFYKGAGKRVDIPCSTSGLNLTDLVIIQKRPVLRGTSMQTLPEKPSGHLT